MTNEGKYVVVSASAETRLEAMKNLEQVVNEYLAKEELFTGFVGGVSVLFIEQMGPRWYAFQALSIEPYVE